MNSGLFVDVLNLHYCVGAKYNGAKLDYQAYLDNLTKNHIQRIGELKWKMAYGTQKDNEANKFIRRLKYLDFDINYLTLVKNKIISTRVDFVIDIVKLGTKLDVAILGTNNIDYIPLIRYLKHQGIKVIIYAARINYDLKDEADFFIEINRDLLIKEINNVSTNPAE